MPTKKQLEVLELYANLMEEVKIRISSIDSALMGSMVIPGAIVREFCFLQLRMICELIALGCLAAHGDIEAATKLKSDYAADKIMNDLEKLYPDFYPKAVTQTKEGLHVHNLVEMDSGFITKKELIELYRKCGDILHKGNLKKLLSTKTPIQTNFPDIVNWVSKIRILLNFHAMVLFNKKVFICMMESKNNGGVQTAIAEQPESVLA